jgi:exodeoxyribonuclease V alpha subunit
MGSIIQDCAMNFTRFIDSPLFSEHPLVFMIAKRIALRLQELTDNNDEVELVFLSVNLLSQSQQEGSSFVDLNQYAEQSMPDHWQISRQFPSINIWRAILEKHSVHFSQLITLEGDKLFFPRMFNVESFIARNLLERAALSIPLNKELWSESKDDYQKIAVANSLSETLSFIVGGPGTGKTTTVSQLLMEILKAEGHKSYRLQLAAPTGKAATRLVQSIQAKLSNSDLPCELKARVPASASTIHRLLGWSNQKQGFKYHKDNPLLVDCLIVDETSMIDADLFSKLLDAIPLTTRLVFLGDPYQLPSVDAGSILADICSPEALLAFSSEKSALNPLLTAGDSPLANQVVQLKKSYRFSDDKGIGAFASAYLNKDKVKLAAALESDEIVLIDKAAQSNAQDPLSIESRLKQHFESLTQTTTIEAAFHLLDQFQCLCANKTGEFSTQYFNASILGHAKAAAMPTLSLHSMEFFHGQPIIIESNRYDLGLFNGDIGIVWLQSDQWSVAFTDEGGPVRFFLAEQLQGISAAFAITVHKSQGSEYDEVAFVFPEVNSPLLTSELVYTAVTRAKKKVLVCASTQEMETALERSSTRKTFLKDELKKSYQIH